MPRSISKYLLLVFVFNIFPISTKRLTKNIDAIIDNYPHIHIGCEIASLEKSKKIIYSRHADHLFIPASNTKVLTTLLALELLGSEYVFETDVYIDGYINDGALYGNLYIRGSGNPAFTSKGLEKIITHLPKIGIEKIIGNCYIDTTLFDTEYYPPGSFIDNIGYSWNTPVTALIIDHKPSILFEEFPINTPAKIDEYIFVNDLLPLLFKKYSITLKGAISSNQIPEDAQIILQHTSPPLSKMLKATLKESDNLYADCIFKKIASCYRSSPATWSNASKILHEFLENELQIPSTELSIKDGSGRSRYNLISPHHLVKLLTYAFKQPYYKTFLECFPINGVDGTMKERSINIYPCIKAKTGTLSGVSALCGYIELPDKTIAFSILINGYIAENIMNPPCKKEIEDAICAEIVNFYHHSSRQHCLN